MRAICLLVLVALAATAFAFDDVSFMEVGLNQEILMAQEALVSQVTTGDVVTDAQVDAAVKSAFHHIFAKCEAIENLKEKKECLFQVKKAQSTTAKGCKAKAKLAKKGKGGKPIAKGAKKAPKGAKNKAADAEKKAALYRKKAAEAKAKADAYEREAKAAAKALQAKAKKDAKAAKKITKKADKKLGKVSKTKKPKVSKAAKKVAKKAAKKVAKKKKAAKKAKKAKKALKKKAKKAAKKAKNAVKKAAKKAKVAHAKTVAQKKAAKKAKKAQKAKSKKAKKAEKKAQKAAEKAAKSGKKADLNKAKKLAKKAKKAKKAVKKAKKAAKKANKKAKKAEKKEEKADAKKDVASAKVSFVSESEFAEEVNAADASLEDAADISRESLQAFVEASSELNPGMSTEEHLETINLDDTDIAHLDIPDVNHEEIDLLLNSAERVHGAHLISFAEEFATATADAEAVLASAHEEVHSTAPAVDPIVAAAEAEMRAALDAPARDPLDLSDLEPIPEL